ncbi:DUF6520 family protein [Mucilaginibacter segetis]|uniref:Uncharacterized protein n=1 Tax=Mucilaginibacter segetis TaxID=2793071 RepID=A0A934PPV3_9SPHI|nr:DUF6520 family protein [Mucilaginibacter segetis]MBK0378544.1 hypothetical protein [Mucilaginibacter segetis]
MKKLILPALAIGLAISTSAFTTNRVAGAFYRYTSSSTAQSDIQNINNYVRDDNACGGGEDVCGVTLTTDEGLGNTPDPTEFSAEQSNLWTSQQNGSAADVNIHMKN